MMARRYRAADEAWRRMGAPHGILESFVDFALRDLGHRWRARPTARWPPIRPVENRHVNHILDTTIAPARHRGRNRGRGRAHRPPHRRAARSRRRARGRDVRDQIGGDRRQRAGAAAAQFRALDDRRLRHQPVRAAGARDLRPAARLDRAPFRRGDDQSDRPRRRDMARRARRPATPSCISTARARCGRAARWATSPGSLRAATARAAMSLARAAVRRAP